MRYQNDCSVFFIFLWLLISNMGFVTFFLKSFSTFPFSYVFTIILNRTNFPYSSKKFISSPLKSSIPGDLFIIKISLELYLKFFSQYRPSSIMSYFFLSQGHLGRITDSILFRSLILFLRNLINMLKSPG